MSEAALRDRIDILEAENAELRRQLRLDPDKQFIAAARSRLGITLIPARLLWALWDGRVHSTGAIMDALYGDSLDPPDAKIVNAWICRLRKALKSADARIRLHWGFGYQLMPEDRVRIAAYIGVEVRP